MPPVAFAPARPWIVTGPGKAFRPLRLAADGWLGLMRLEPGGAVALHRHTGDVHAFNLPGTGRSSAPVSGPGPGTTGTSQREPSAGGRWWVMSRASVTSRLPVSSSTWTTTARSPRPSARRPSAASTWPGAASTACAHWSRSTLRPPAEVTSDQSCPARCVPCAPAQPGSGQPGLPERPVPEPGPGELPVEVRAVRSDLPPDLPGLRGIPTTSCCAWSSPPPSRRRCSARR